MARTHIVIPDDLIREIDQLIGPRQRSRFVREAVEAKLERVRLMAAVEATAGSLADVPIPGWETSESAAEWVRKMRGSSDPRTDDSASALS